MNTSGVFFFSLNRTDVIFISYWDTVAYGTTTNYHYFNGQLMYETVGSTITALYLRSADGKLLGARLNQSGANNYYYYHYDAQGNVAAVTDASTPTASGTAKIRLELAN